MEKREKGREKHPCERNTLIGCLVHELQPWARPGSSLQPRYDLVSANGTEATRAPRLHSGGGFSASPRVRLFKEHVGVGSSHHFPNPPEAHSLCDLQQQQQQHELNAYLGKNINAMRSSERGILPCGPGFMAMLCTTQNLSTALHIKIRSPPP